MKYQSELIKDIVDKRGHEKSSLHYESECIETWIKESEGSYPKLCDYQSEWLNYINENEIGKFPYETVTANPTATVNNVVPYAYKSAILSGNTKLVDKFGYELDTIDNVSIITTKGYMLNVSTGEQTEIVGHKVTDFIYLKDSITKITFDGGVTQRICFYNYDKTFISGDSTSGTNTKTFNVPEGAKYFRISYNYSTELTTINDQNGTKVYDYNNDLQLVSVKMSVLKTTGKNLINMNDYALTDGVSITQQNENSITFNAPYTWGGLQYRMQLNPNTKYTVSMDRGENTIVQLYVRLKNENGNYSGAFGGGNKYSFTTNNTGFVLITIETSLPNQTNLHISNLQLEEGSTATPYEPYKSNILSTPEDLKLRGISDVKDTLDCLTGELTQRVGEMVLNGNEEWSDATIFNNGDCKAYSLSVNGLTSNIVCDGLKIIPNSLEFGTEEGVFVNNNLLIVKKNIATRELLKQWLSQNPTTVQYKLATPIVKSVDLTIVNQDNETLNKIKPIEGTMNISTDGTPIKPTATMEIPVEAITQNLNSFIREE